MIIGIAILGLFISTLGESLIESRLLKMKNKNISKPNDNRYINNKDIDNSNNNNNAIKEETKLLIKNKIDILESLKEDEFNVLIKLIKAIYYRD